MPRKPKSSASEAPLAPIPSEILDQFVRQGPLTPEELDAAVPSVQEGDHRAGAGRRAEPPSRVSAGRDASPTTRPIIAMARSGKTVLTDDGPLALDVPRDRDGTFEPRLIPQTRAPLHRLRRQDRWRSMRAA